MSRRARVLRAAAALSTLLLASGCTGGKAAKQVPSYSSVRCPDAVSSQIVLRLSCGYLTVLENRAKPAEGTIRLLVVRVLPPGSNLAPDPVVVPGGNDVGLPPEYGGLGGRANREWIILSQRGVGLSEPSLACPEIDAVSTQLLGHRLSDPDRRAPYLDAVTACHDRLVRQGIDLDGYTIEQSAADVEDLVKALGLRSWNLTTYGSTSRVALEVIRDAPAGLRAAVFDTPQFPQVDNIGEAVPATVEALNSVVQECRAQPPCAKAFPGLSGMLGTTSTRLDTSPETIHVDATESANGQAATVVVDAGLLVRMIRARLLQPGGEGLAQLPAAIAAAGSGGFGPFSPATVASLTGDRALCLGYWPGCGISSGFSAGTYYSFLCHDDAPFVDTQTLGSGMGVGPGYGEDFGSNPHLEACDRWRVRPAGAREHEPVTANVPTLILSGQFDALMRGTTLRQAAASLPTHFIVIVPGQTTNVLSPFDCPISIRNAWIDHPTEPPDAACLKDLPVVKFETSTLPG